MSAATLQPQNSSSKSGGVRMALSGLEIISKFEDPIRKSQLKDGQGNDEEDNDTDLVSIFLEALKRRWAAADLV